MRKRYFAGIAVLVMGAALTLWWSSKTPTPIDELVPPTADIDLEVYDGSMSPEAGAPDVLLLGSSHLAQQEHNYAPAAFDQVTEALAAFSPDMVVVEYLPPDYPEGKGRDYRPTLDYEAYAQTWEMDADSAEALIAAHRAAEGPPSDPCRLAQAYFLQRDLVNGAYYALEEDCPAIRRQEDLAGWLDRRSEHEMARIAFPVARASGVRELVSFDYQGDDASWFIGEVFSEALRSGRFWAIADFWPILPRVGTANREREAHIEGREEDLIDMLYLSNSPEHIALQYWAYEEQIRSIGWEGAGPRQVENDWLRNEHMFDYMKQAIEEHAPERVLVVVGSGHKYFLDELVREEGYRWIDPREWLPDPAAPLPAAG